MHSKSLASLAILRAKHLLDIKSVMINDRRTARYEISHKQALENDLSHDISRFWTSATSYWNSADDFP